MNVYRTIDRETWPRRDLFDFYLKFDNPCFNISVPLEADALHTAAKDRKESFFLLSLYAILRAANAVPQLRQRLVDGLPVEFESIAVMTPIMTEQEMFRQIWCEYAPTFPAFAADAGPKAEAARRATPSPAPSPMANHGEDFLCASCLPWVHFSAVTQAEYTLGQSVPILSWGKLKNGIIPVSGKFNHAFVDGLHAGRFFANLEQSFANPDTLWTPASV